MKHLVHAAVIGLILGATPALAQDEIIGIAFVYAPEMGGGVATGPNPIVAFERARAECMESGALENDCLWIAWCYPAGWSIDIFAQHQEGPHWHEVVCGLPTEAIARATAEAVYDKQERGFLIECSMVQLYDPTGTAQMDW